MTDIQKINNTGFNQPETFSKFGNNFQQKLAKQILLERTFADQIKEVLTPEMFELKYLQYFVKAIFNYKDKYEVHPSLQVVDSILKTEYDSSNNSVNEQIHEFYKTVCKDSETGQSDDDVDYIKDTALDFCKKQHLKSAMIKSVDLLQHASFDEISKLINNSLKLGTDNKFGYDYIQDFEKRYEMVLRNPVSTGWTEIDRITKGGLGCKELSVVISSTGGGKSMSLVHLASQALLAGKNVVYYTLELQDTVVAARFDSCITGFALDDLYVFKEEVYERIKPVKGKLIIKEYPSKSASTTTIKNHLDRLKQRGVDIDFIVVDYGDLLKPTVSGSKEKRHDLESIFEELRGIAQRFNCPLVTATQSNRCFSVDTKLYVIRKNKKECIQIGNIKVGDLVETHKGNKLVEYVSPIEKQKVFQIKLKSGRIVICSKKHMFPTSNNKNESISSGLSIGTSFLIKKEIEQNGDRC